jgi:hypothetical protein
VREVWLNHSDGLDFLNGALCDSSKFFRFHNFIYQFGSQEKVWTPTLQLHWDGNSFEFIQGRHRFMWHWLVGYETMPFTVDRNDVQRFRKLFSIPI